MGKGRLKGPVVVFMDNIARYMGGLEAYEAGWCPEGQERERERKIY